MEKGEREREREREMPIFPRFVASPDLHGPQTPESDDESEEPSEHRHLTREMLQYILMRRIMGNTNNSG